MAISILSCHRYLLFSSVVMIIYQKSDQSICPNKRGSYHNFCTNVIKVLVASCLDLDTLTLSDICEWSRSLTMSRDSTLRQTFIENIRLGQNVSKTTNTLAYLPREKVYRTFSQLFGTSRENAV